MSPIWHTATAHTEHATKAQAIPPAFQVQMPEHMPPSMTEQQRRQPPLAGHMHTADLQECALKKASIAPITNALSVPGRCNSSLSDSSAYSDRLSLPATNFERSSHASNGTAQPEAVFDRGGGASHGSAANCPFPSQRKSGEKQWLPLKSEKRSAVSPSCSAVTWSRLSHGGDSDRSHAGVAFDWVLNPESVYVFGGSSATAGDVNQLSVKNEPDRSVSTAQRNEHEQDVSDVCAW